MSVWAPGQQSERALRRVYAGMRRCGQRLPRSRTGRHRLRRLPHGARPPPRPAFRTRLSPARRTSATGAGPMGLEQACAPLRGAARCRLPDRPGRTLPVRAGRQRKDRGDYAVPRGPVVSARGARRSTRHRVIWHPATGAMRPRRHRPPDIRPMPQGGWQIPASGRSPREWCAGHERAAPPACCGRDRRTVRDRGRRDRRSGAMSIARRRRSRRHLPIPSRSCRRTARKSPVSSRKSAPFGCLIRRCPALILAFPGRRIVGQLRFGAIILCSEQGRHSNPIPVIFGSEEWRSTASTGKS